MPSYEIQFPTNISYGSSGGPGFSTISIGMEKGTEQRVSKRNRPRRRYDVSYGVRTYSDLQDVIRHYMTVRGSLYSFRYKDWLDFSTNRAGTNIGSFTFSDEALAKNHGVAVVGGGQGSGTGFQVQLKKRYCVTQGGKTTGSSVRNITKPVLNQVKLGVMTSDDGEITEITSSEYVVDYRTGTCTLEGKTVAAGDTIYGGCQFDVPVRFTKEIDTLISITPESFDTGSLDSIEVIEDLSVVHQEDEFLYGGYGGIIKAETNNSLHTVQGRVIGINEAESGQDLVLQDPQTIPAGGPYFYIYNDSGEAIGLTDSGFHLGLDSSVLNNSIGDGVTVEMWIIEHSDGSKEWKIWGGV